MRPRGNIHQRSPGSFRLRYTLGKDSFGKRRTACVTVRGTRKDAERELTRLLRAVDTQEHVDATGVTLRRWFEAWLDTVRVEISPKAHERYSEIVRCYLIPPLGAIRVQKLTATKIQEVYNGLHRRDGEPLSPSTRRYIHVILKVALTRAVEQNVLVRNPADVVRPPRVERKEITTHTVEQSARLLSSIRHMHVYWPILLAVTTGMRRGEVLAIRWRNVDLERGIARVVQSLEQTKEGLRFKDVKTHCNRAINLPPFVVEEFRRFKLHQAEQLLRIGVRQTGETLVCCREDGEPKQPRSLTHEFSHLIGRLADLPPIRLHDLRHSHATQLLVDGVHPKIAQERLGHSTITTTMDLYSHVTETMQRDAVAQLDAAFRLVIGRTTQ
jgi:integrase